MFPLKKNVISVQRFFENFLFNVLFVHYWYRIKFKFVYDNIELYILSSQLHQTTKQKFLALLWFIQFSEPFLRKTQIFSEKFQIYVTCFKILYKIFLDNIILFILKVKKGTWHSSEANIKEGCVQTCQIDTFGILFWSSGDVCPGF